MNLRTVIIASLVMCSIIGCTPSPKVCKEKCYTVELATTPQERSYGLMNRTSLPQESGMLFVYETPGIYKFWMKNTLIPLDMIWMDEKGKILHIERYVQPCIDNPCSTYGPEMDATYILELNAGETKDWKIGDSIQLKNI